jgi:tetratricopeptide (TPR) repeat protein
MKIMIKRSMSTTWPFLFPDFAVAYNNRGVAYVSLKRPEKALEDFNKAIALNSTYVDAYKNRGRYYIVKEHYDDAIQDLTAAIRLNPDNQSLYGIRGKRM